MWSVQTPFKFLCIRRGHTHTETAVLRACLRVVFAFVRQIEISQSGCYGGRR